MSKFEVFMAREGFQQVVTEDAWTAWCHTIEPVLVTCSATRCDAVFAQVSRPPSGLRRLREPDWTPAYSTCIHDPRAKPALFSAAMADLRNAHDFTAWGRGSTTPPAMQTSSPTERWRRVALLPTAVRDRICPFA